ncbi:MAG TPA: CpsD/CapB family tyrosine-protein kinase [Candidatus Acidoferrum sp.]|nr:CpsD/CapB family tyrosine-protein kinase [Candidatus Acidoferrum sp.]
MSKFFDESLKSLTSAEALENPKVASVPDLGELTAAAPKDPTKDISDSRLEQCGKIEIPLAEVFRAQFQGSKKLEAAEESYRALRTRLFHLRSAQGFRSLVVTSAVQGEGKTLTSLNLALCCAQLRDMRVLLIDGDIRSNGLTRLIGAQHDQGLSEVLAGECELQKAILATDLANLYVLPAGTPSMPPPELFAGRRWQELIGWCNEPFKLVLVDSPPALNLADVELITAACDGVLVVVRAQQTRRDALRKSASLIDAKKLLGVVYNGTAEGSHDQYRYA